MVFCKHGREVPKSQIAFSWRAFHGTIEFRVVTRAVVYGVWSNVEFYGRGGCPSYCHYRIFLWARTMVFGRECIVMYVFSLDLMKA